MKQELQHLIADRMHNKYRDMGWPTHIIEVPHIASGSDSECLQNTGLV